MHQSQLEDLLKHRFAMALQVSGTAWLERGQSICFFNMVPGDAAGSVTAL